MADSADIRHVKRRSQIAFVAIGASGGAGLHDIEELLRRLSPAPTVSVLVVLHRPSDRISYLQQILSRAALMPVLIPEQGDRYQPGRCYIGGTDRHLTLIGDDRASLIAGPRDLYRNRTVDLLFSSIAAHAGSRSIGIVLSGAMSDGSRGLAAIHNAGGTSMVLGDSGTAEHGMPASAASFDRAIDFIGSVPELAVEIKSRISIAVH